MLITLFRLWQLLCTILTVVAAADPTPTKRDNSGFITTTQDGHFLLNGRYALIDREYECVNSPVWD